MAKRMKEDDTNEELMNAFKKLDIDKDNYISKEDLQAGLVKIGSRHLTDFELEELFEKADLDKDGKLSYDEFVRVITPK